MTPPDVLIPIALPEPTERPKPGSVVTVTAVPVIVCVVSVAPAGPEQTDTVPVVQSPASEIDGKATSDASAISDVEAKLDMSEDPVVS